MRLLMYVLGAADFIVVFLSCWLISFVRSFILIIPGLIYEPFILVLLRL